MKPTKGILSAGIGALLALSLSTQATSPAAGEALNQTIAPAGVGVLPAPYLHYPPVGTLPAGEEAENDEDIPCRTTFDPNDIAAEKAAAEAERDAADGNGVPGILESPFAPVNLFNFDGMNQSNYIPPDTHGSIGYDDSYNLQYFEVTNSRYAIYDGNGVSLKNGTLNSIVGYSTRDLFDPRVIFDMTNGRWIFAAAAFAESAAVEYLFIAVSQGSDARGPYYITKINVHASPFVNNALWDYNQLGQDSNAILLTANVFGSSFLGASTFALPKAALYSGQTSSFKLFSRLAGSLAPPIVVDDNPSSFFVSASGNGRLTLYRMDNSGDPNAVTLVQAGSVAVPGYSAPGSARQTCSTRLPTLDGRFQNASTQVGGSLFNIHAVNSGGFSRCRLYEVDITTASLVTSDTFGASATSDDFCPAVAADGNATVYVTWSSTDSAAGLNAQVRASGRIYGDPSSLGPGALVYQSSFCYTGSRWGDYSAVSIDPFYPNCAWVCNEIARSANVWGTEIGWICLQ